MVPNFLQVDHFQKVKISSFVLSYFCGFKMNQVSEFFKGWTSIPGIKFDAKILIRSSWIVACSQQNTSKAVSMQII